MKKTDLEKLKGLKVNNKLAQSASPDRFAQGAGQLANRKELRRRDQELGLVPFATKLNKDLARQLREEAEARGIDLGELVAELLLAGLAARGE